MARLVILGVLALVAAISCAATEKTWAHKLADKDFLKRQADVYHLLYHVNEPNHHSEQVTIAKEWSFEKNFENFQNVTAVKYFVEMFESGYMLPRGAPFAMHHPAQQHYAKSLFLVFWHAKDWETFYKSACWAREYMNEGLFMYTFSVAIIHRHDCQGLILPPPYEIMPNYFIDGEVMKLAEKINVQGEWNMESYPQVHKWDNNYVIDSNWTSWHSHLNEEFKLTYFTEDIGLNSYYYYMNLDYPSWMGSDVCHLIKDRRGELWYYQHQQLLARYYLERLSNGMGEIPMFSWHMPIETGYDSDLMYDNGIEMPVRPNDFNLRHPEYLQHLVEVEDWERRIREAIDMGYLMTETHEQISLRTPESIDVLARAIESNLDSPNRRYYRDFVTVAKYLLGNANAPHDWNHYAPSVLENWQTAMRDPVFYQLWKRVMWLFWQWQEHLAPHTTEELIVPDVHITEVEVDKLMTYFEHYHVNLTNYLLMNKREVETQRDDTSVLVRQTRLNHKVFNVNMKVQSEAEKTVVVKFFLGPKYDSHGRVIPIHENRVNFVELDMFTFDLKKGENMIVRSSNEFAYLIEDWTSSHVLFHKVMDALHHEETKFQLDMSEAHNGWSNRLLLPKGTRAGMPFVFMAYIHEFKAPKVPFGTGFDSTISTGLGSGARYLTDMPFGFPLDRRVYEWATHIPNMLMKDVQIFHKKTAEISIPHMEM